MTKTMDITELIVNIVCSIVQRTVDYTMKQWDFLVNGMCERGV